MARPSADFPRQVAMSDRADDLKRRAIAALRFDDRLNAATLDLDVETRGGVVALSGTVQHPWQKFLAEDILRHLPGIAQVENLVLVEPPSTRTDEQIKQALIESYIFDPYLDERAISITVEEGVVYLRGRVETLLRKRLAGVLAWWVAGVRDVVNELDVERPEPDTSEYLAEAVKVVLEKDPLVDGSEVAVHATDDGVVTLTGAIRSAEEREAAENDVWCVLGVRHVNNWLGVVPPGLPAERSEPGR